MIVRSWGARGSIPVSGPSYVRYGGDTTCLELRTARDTVVVVDAGSGIRRLGNSLVEQDRLDVTMILTHSHWDHILGFPFFKPVYHPQGRLRVYGCPRSQGNMQKLLARTMAAPYFPVPFEQVMATVEYHNHCSVEEVLRVDDMDVRAIPISHPNMGLGYKFTEQGKTFVFLTDNELGHVHRGGRTFDDYAEFCLGADLLIHDAEYTDREYQTKTRQWGHSTYKEALALAMAAGVKRFGLFHHNQDRSDEQVDAIVAECRGILRDKGVDMECFGVSQTTELAL